MKKTYDCPVIGSEELVAGPFFCFPVQTQLGRPGVSIHPCSRKVQIPETPRTLKNRASCAILVFVILYPFLRVREGGGML